MLAGHSFIIASNKGCFFTTVMEREERAFVKCKLKILIQKAAKEVAEKKGWNEWEVDKEDVKEFLEGEIRIEPASGRDVDVECLVHEFHGTNKGTSTKLPNKIKQEERSEELKRLEIIPKPSGNQVRDEAEIESTGDGDSPRKKAKLTYEARMVNNQRFKMLVARVDKDYKFRVYQLDSSFLAQNAIKTISISGAMAGAIVGGAIYGVMMGAILTATGGVGGAVIAYSFGKLLLIRKNEEVMTALNIFNGEDKDRGVWWEEGRYVLCMFKHMYQYLAEVMSFEELD